MSSDRETNKIEDLSFPVEITAIRPQKKRNNRFSLYQGKRFLLGVSADTLLSFHLKKGDQLSAVQFQQITDEEERRTVREYMIRLLGRRDHSGTELEQKARGKGYPEEIVQHVQHELSEKGYVDDNIFASRFVTDKLAINRWGPLRIKMALRKKGIPTHVTDRILQEKIDDLELKKICVDLVLARRKHFLRESDSFKRKQKISAWLQRKGFYYSTIEEAFPEIIKRLNVS
ncbi:MAG: RecX family transcriptional regulator [Balneolaceae bacterium]